MAQILDPTSFKLDYFSYTNTDSKRILDCKNQTKVTFFIGEWICYCKNNSYAMSAIDIILALEFMCYAHLNI